MDWMDLCGHEGAKADIASNIRMGTFCREDMGWDCQKVRQTLE